MPAGPLYDRPAQTKRGRCGEAMSPDVYLTAAIVFFGFLFAAFWWTLNRELAFDPEMRHREGTSHGL